MESKELEALLKDQQVDIRLQATRRLAEIARFDEKLFLMALGDFDWRVRKEAISVFMQQQDAVSRIELIIDQLSHPDNAGLRNAAIEILIDLGPQISRILLSRISSSDAEVRKFIVDILGEICPSSCVTELLPHLQDEDENVRYAVVETLGKLGSVEAVDALLELLGNSGAGLQFVVFEALTAIGKGVPAARIIPYAQNALLRKSVFNCLGQLSDTEAIPVLLKGLSDPMRKNRDVALLAFGQLIKSLNHKDCPEVDPQSDQVVDLLFAYLQHEDPAYKSSACFILSLFPNAEVIQRILPLLQDERLRADVVASAQLIPKVIWKAFANKIRPEDSTALYLIYLLGELEYVEILPLATAGLSSADPQLRYVSTVALGKIRALELIPQLGDRFSDEVPDIREAASEALCRLGCVDPKGMIRTVSPYLESPTADLRLLAVRTLGGLSTDLVENYLLLALKDVDAEVRCEALRGLSGHKSQRLFSGLSLALTDEIPDVRRLAAAAFGAFPAERSTPVLTYALEDSDPWVRMEAIRTLSGGKESEVRAFIQRGLADPVGMVVIAALETAQRLLHSKADIWLQKALDYDDQEVAATAVRLLLSDDTVSDLLNHARPEVRLRTVQEIGRVTDPEKLFMLEERLQDELDAQVRMAIETVLRVGATGN